MRTSDHARIMSWDLLIQDFGVIAVQLAENMIAPLLRSLRRHARGTTRAQHLTPPYLQVTCKPCAVLGHVSSSRIYACIEPEAKPCLQGAQEQQRARVSEVDCVCSEPALEIQSQEKRQMGKWCEQLGFSILFNVFRLLEFAGNRGCFMRAGSLLLSRLENKAGP